MTDALLSIPGAAAPRHLALDSVYGFPTNAGTLAAGLVRDGSGVTAFLKDGVVYASATVNFNGSAPSTTQLQFTSTAAILGITVYVDADPSQAMSFSDGAWRLSVSTSPWTGGAEGKISVVVAWDGFEAADPRIIVNPGTL